MSDPQEALAAVLANLEVSAAELTAATGKVEAGAQFLTGRFFVAQILEGITHALAAEQSPFVNRKAAAARWFCSEDEIDRVAKPDVGILTPLYRGTAPLFEKAQGDAAIREGKWLAKGKHRTSNLEHPTANQRRAA